MQQAKNATLVLNTHSDFTVPGALSSVIASPQVLGSVGRQDLAADVGT